MTNPYSTDPEPKIGMYENPLLPPKREEVATADPSGWTEPLNTGYKPKSNAPEMPNDMWSAGNNVTTSVASANRTDKWNTFAIIAFILSFVGFALVSLIFAIISLVQISKSGEKGKVFAILAIVFSVIGGLFYSLLVFMNIFLSPSSEFLIY